MRRCRTRPGLPLQHFQKEKPMTRKFLRAAIIYVVIKVVDWVMDWWYPR